MGVKKLISNVIRHKKPPAPMSHAQFENLGTSVRKLAKVAREERLHAGGDPDAGKDTHFCRSGKKTLAAPGHVGKASRRKNTEVFQQLTVYLLEGLKNGRFTAEQVENALKGLPSEARKSFDVVVLADQFDGILSVINPEPLKRLSAATSASAGAARTSLEKLQNGCLSDGDVVRFDETARTTDTERQRAIDKLEHALTQATDCGDKFTTACGWNPENFNLDNSRKLRDWFNRMFEQIPATKSLKAMSLPQDLLVAKFDYVTELKESLELLLSQRDARGHEPDFHDEVQALGDKITAYIARYTRELFTAAEVLTQFPYYPTDPARRKPLLEFANALAELARALLDPASPIVQIYEWAQDAKVSAAKDKVAAQVAAKENAEVKRRLDAGDRLAREVNAAYADFEEIYLRPPSGVQQRLLNWMTPLLNANTHTKALPADSLHDHLFQSAPEEIKRLYADLELKIDVWNRADEYDAESVQSMLDLSAQLSQRIDAYVAQIEAVSRILQDRPDGQPLPAGAAAAIERIAHLMAQYVYALGDSQGFLEQARAHAEKVHGEAGRLLNQFAESPAPEVVPDDPPLESLTFEPSPSPETSVVPQPLWLSAQPRADRQLLTTPLRTSVGRARARTPDEVPVNTKAGWREAVERWTDSVRGRLEALREQLTPRGNTLSASTSQQQAFRDWLADAIPEYPAIAFVTPDTLGQLMDYRWDDLSELKEALDRMTALQQGADLDETIVEISSRVIAAIDAHLGAIKALHDLMSRGAKDTSLSLDQRRLLTDATDGLKGLREQLVAPEGWLMAVRRDASDAETTASQRMFGEEIAATAPVDAEPWGDGDDFLIDLRMALDGKKSVPAEELARHAREQQERKQLSKNLKRN